MNRRMALGLGALALAWFAGDVLAQETPYRRTQVRPAPLPVATAPTPATTMDIISERLFGLSEMRAPANVQPVPPATGFAVDRPVPASAVVPVQYVVQTAVPAAPGTTIQAMPTAVNAGSPAIATSGCPCVIDDCARHCGVFSADVGIYVLQPHWDTNPAYRVERDEGSVDHREQRDFSHSMAVAPLVTLAYVSAEGWGVRSRYWQLDASADRAITNNGSLLISSAAPLGLSIFDIDTDGTDNVRWVFESELRVHVVDIEATQNFNWDCWNFVAAAGVRYAYLSQSYDVTQTPPNDTTSTGLDSGMRFRGAGPTLALTVRRPVGDTGLAFFANGRGSLLYGQHRQKAILVTGEGEDQTSVASRVNEDDLLPILEIELGAQYAVCWNSAHLFFQVGAVGQTWLGAGNASNTDLIVGVANDNNQANLGFVGFMVTAGVDF